MISGGIKTFNFSKKETFKNTFFYRIPPVAASFRASVPLYSPPEKNCFRILESTDVKGTMGYERYKMDYADVCHTNF